MRRLTIQERMERLERASVSVEAEHNTISPDIMERSCRAGLRLARLEANKGDKLRPEGESN